MSSIPTYAVIPTCGRPELVSCLSALNGQVDGIVAVVNSGYTGDGLSGVYTIPDPRPERNISRWWNLGIDFVAGLAGTPAWNTLVLNDDVIAGPGTVSVLADRLRYRKASVAFPGPSGTELLLSTPSSPRIAGWCFMLPGEDRMRADESLVWWCGDNDLDMRARAQGRGALSVPDLNVRHTDPNGYTNRIPELSVQAGLDVEAYTAKWGRSPY